MINLSTPGRIFYCLSIAALGFLTLFFHDFPYFFIPAKHVWLSEHLIFVYFSGGLRILAGVCIAFERTAMPISLLLGTVLLLIFCFYFIPYQLISSPNYMRFGDWENAFKELTLAGGAFVIADSYRRKAESPFMAALKKLAPLGSFLFGLSILTFGISHFIYAKEAADYIPAWIPYHLFWMYVTGSALICSSMGIILKIKSRLMATLLGSMIFIWVVILHIPKSMAAPFAENSGEVSSAFLALAYSGIAFVIAGGKSGRSHTE